jgi:hypothetical protein
VQDTSDALFFTMSRTGSPLPVVLRSRTSWREHNETCACGVHTGEVRRAGRRLSDGKESVPDPGGLPYVVFQSIMYKVQVYRLYHIRNLSRGEPGHTREKPGRSWEGEIQRAPGLTIDHIVVPRRTQACTPDGISLYAIWLFLGRISPCPWDPGSLRAACVDCALCRPVSIATEPGLMWESRSGGYLLNC